MLKFVGGRKAVWAAIEAVGAKGGRKTAAIAWVSSSNRISFGAGDRLVVDASDDAIRQGLTNAAILRSAFERGAELRSRSGLHAKVVLIGRTLFVGSMNSSGRSDGKLAEAAMFTTELDAVAAGLGWVEDLFDASLVIDDDFLRRIEAITPVKRKPFEGSDLAGKDVPETGAPRRQRQWFYFTSEYTDHVSEGQEEADDIRAAGDKKGRAEGLIADYIMGYASGRLEQQVRRGDRVFHAVFEGARLLNIWRAGRVYRIQKAGKRLYIHLLWPKSAARRLKKWKDFSLLASDGRPLVAPLKERKLAQTRGNAMEEAWDRRGTTR